MYYSYVISLYTYNIHQFKVGTDKHDMYSKDIYNGHAGSINVWPVQNDRCKSMGINVIPMFTQKPMTQKSVPRKSSELIITEPSYAQFRHTNHPVFPPHIKKE